MSNQNGFTLYEALIALTVTSVLLATGLPAFSGLKARTDVTTEHDNFVTAVNHARTLAITMATRIVICPSAKPELGCNSEADWHEGWITFVDDNRDRELDDDETILVHNGASESVTITSSRFRRRITFMPSGTAGGSNLTVRICPAIESSAVPRAVIISNSGRPRSTELPPSACAAT